MRRVHKWPKAALALYEKNKPKGTLVKFRAGGDVRFFVTVWKIGRKKRRMVFRVHPGRQYIDRFHWWFVQERWEFKNTLPDSARVVDVINANDADIMRWFATHYWTCAQKGYPVAAKWLRKFNMAEHDKQVAAIKRGKYGKRTARYKMPRMH